MLSRIGFFPILFITHENYIRLAEDEKARKTFIKGRRLLIIDESIDICEIVKFSSVRDKEESTICLEDIEKISTELKEEDKQTFKNIVNPLLNKFDNIKNEKDSIINKVYNFKVKHKQYNEQIDYFSKKIVTKYDKFTQNKLKKVLKIIKLIYNDTCLVNKKSKEDDEKKQEIISLKTINRNKKMWTLENNIILDASALLEMKYTLNNKLYFLMNCQNTLNYSNWHIEYVWGSSTKSAKRIGYKKSKEDKAKYKRFLLGCSKIIEDLGISNVLVVCHKDEHIQTNTITDEEILMNPFSINIPMENIAHFGDITGKREYGKLHHILITHTPNYEDSDYILQYMYYSNKRYSDNEIFDNDSNIGLGYIPIFKNQELQEFKEKIIANQIYQAVCRVNRNMEYETTVIIISKYLGSILYVRDMLGCECYCNTDYDIYFGIKDNKVNTDRKNNSNATKLQNFFLDVLNGNIENYKVQYKEINSNIIKINKEDIKNILMLDNTQFNKAKSKNDKFISNNSIICCRDYYYFIIDTT